ncbi:MAG: efflux RND transporter permease subunit, partial [Candidatus Electrothrix sp. AUS3]|nr:efflux RND transporter permease subunit [Candidatus Electrothrix gigas]
FGLLLVLVTLGLFLEPRLAFWVSMGIPISIAGSLLILYFTGGSINMISMFAFIITLGIVVDDAVVVGENIFHKRQQGLAPLNASVTGVQEMSAPVLIAVATNIIAFLPLLFVSGSTGRFFAMLPAVVISVFLLSLIECMASDTGLFYHNWYYDPHKDSVVFFEQRCGIFFSLGKRDKSFSFPFIWSILWANCVKAHGMPTGSVKFSFKLICLTSHLGRIDQREFFSTERDNISVRKVL